MSTAAPLLLDRPHVASNPPKVGPREDRFEREANRLAERLAWRVPATAASPDLDAGGGAPVPDAAREGLEAELPYDLHDVRLHTGLRGQAVARDLGAAAVTLGSDISFAAGAYETGTIEGRRILAHEVVHAAQQGALPPRGGAGSHVTRSPAGTAQRTPGVDAQDSWNDLILQTTFAPRTDERIARGNEATKRFLSIAEGRRLINRLWRLAHLRKKAQFGIGVSYVDQLPAAAGTSPAIGWFTPSNNWANRYDVYVEQITPPPPGVIQLPGGKTASGIYYEHSDPASDMAATLHHELMHVEFVRAELAGTDPYTGDPRTGHGANPEKDTDPLFFEREQAANKQLDALEKAMRAEAERKRREEERLRDEAARKKSEEEAARAPRPEPAPGPPSSVGGQVVAEGGVVGLGGTRGVGIVGADLVLGRLSSFHVGPRGVFLSPGHLLVGGMAGVRLINDESPIYFDIEAGIVAELRPEDTDRLTNHFAVLAGGSLGHEFGTAGTRMFVKVGGFALITDKGDVGGGATAGVGVRF
jgi:Domain of unknown function (DUF4157)